MIRLMLLIVDTGGGRGGSVGCGGAMGACGAAGGVRVCRIHGMFHSGGGRSQCA